jgi:hypothetical protein
LPTQTEANDDQRFGDKEYMISILNVEGHVQIQIANENLNRNNRKREQRLLDKAESKRHLPHSNIRDKEPILNLFTLLCRCIDYELF